MEKKGNVAKRQLTTSCAERPSTAHVLPPAWSRSASHAFASASPWA